GAVAAATHHRGDGAAGPWGRPTALQRWHGPGLRAALGPGTARCDTGRALSPAPTAAGAAGRGGDHVPPPPAPGAPATKPSPPAPDRHTPRVQQARTAYRRRTAALELRRLKCGARSSSARTRCRERMRA